MEIFRKKNKGDIWSMLERGKNRDKKVQEVAKRPEIWAVLEEYGKSPGDIEGIFSNLMRSGTGEQLADFVIRTPKALTMYLDWKMSGIADIEINSKLRDAFKSYRFT
jgi:hypothetical protein